MSANADKFLPYGRQSIDDDDIQAVTNVLKSDFLTTGPEVSKFEKALCHATRADQAIVCGNGTHALHLACMAIDIQPGDTAIVPAITFLATANAVRYCGADVIFADCNPDTGLMEVEHIEQAIKSANVSKPPKAILPVHLAGQGCDLKAMREYCNKDDIKIIADSCHALGGEIHDSTVGECKYEDLATFSFHPVKTIAMGEGGAITTRNTNYAEKMRTLRHHGMQAKAEQGPWYHEMHDLGYNYRASDIQCALGTSQLSKLSKFVKKRDRLAAIYDELLAELSPAIKVPQRLDYTTPAWHLYAARIDFKVFGLTRTEFINALKELNIGSQVHYIPVHTQPYYQKLYGRQNLIGAQSYYERTLSLPLFPDMDEEDVHRVVNSIKKILG